MLFRLKKLLAGDMELTAIKESNFLKQVTFPQVSYALLPLVLGEGRGRKQVMRYQGRREMGKTWDNGFQND